MFGFIAKMPKLAVIGFVVLLIGFAPAILATINIDTTAPDLFGLKPSGTGAEPSPLTIGTYEPLGFATTASDFNPLSAYCTVKYVEVGGTPTEDVIDMDQGQSPKDFVGEWPVPDVDGMVEFAFELSDWAGWKGEASSFGELGEADGDFYVKDADDTAWMKATETSIHTFDNPTIEFKFLAVNAGWAITNVRVDILGEGTLYLSEGTPGDTEWNGASITLADGTYEVHGYFDAFGQTWQTMSLLIGSGEEPVPPSEWSTYDWLKIIGVGLIVVGFIWKK